MDKVNSPSNYNSQDLDTSEIMVSSIRAGMKREFAFIMKAQSGMKELPAGRRRVTRSQSVGSSGKSSVVADRKISKKLKGSDYKKLKKDEKEKLGGDDVGNLGVVDVLGGENGSARVVLEVESNVVDCARNLDADLAALGMTHAEKVGSGCGEGAVQSMCTVSPATQVDGSNKVSVHEDDHGALREVDLGCESAEEGSSMASEKHLRRFTRSALKLQDGDAELGTEAGPGAVSVETLTPSPSKLEMKMSKKIGLNRIPGKLRDLLETGLLEGLRVRYIHGSKRRRQPESELQGVIQGTGILCSCDECGGREVITPNLFESHARSGNKRPPEYIYLENGKSLRDVLNACKSNISESIESVIQKAIGRSNYTTAFCLNCREMIPEAGSGRAMLLCDSCVLSKESGASHTQISDTDHRAPLVGSSAPVSSSSQPEITESAQVSSDSHQIKRQGKLTRKDLRMHKSVLAEDLLPDGAALQYVMHGKIRLQGVKQDGAIFCFCCREVVSPSQFEAHAGFSSRRKPYMSIYTSNGISLHQLSLELSKTRKSSPEENDDLCSICEDGGDLLCCENCPRAFHTECVGLSSIPTGTWYCKYCRNMFEKEKFEENNVNAIAAGRVPGSDPLEEITRRCIRIIGNFETNAVGGCIICRRQDFSRSGFNDHTVIICDQCEKEYHVKCLKEQKIDDLKALPESEWFCSRQCNNVHSVLEKLIADGEQMLPEAVLNILEKKGDGQGSEPFPNLDIRWRLLRGKDASEDTRPWLSGAVSIFHDRFDPIADARTSRLDLIPTMVYGRKFKDQEFYGMYCAILMVDSVVVSAAIVRVFGEEVAELPLVATKSDCQGKGYFQSLYTCIEDLLQSLNVKDLVLPAADEAESLWKNRFGFQKLEQEQLDEYRKSYQMMIFEGTSVLHKSLLKS
ncbi:hypothetical protein ACS0TY_014816 [Phlomoides rotata]